MWKESYRLGVEAIDLQHQKLFEMAGELVREIEGEQRPEVYKKIIEFLQDYVKVHFQDEEAYIHSLGYPEEEEHRRQHQELTKQVEKYACQLQETNYDYRVVKKLAGMLGAWLVYHVVKEDLKYAGKGTEAAQLADSSYMSHFVNSTVQVLEAMAGLDSKDVDHVNVYDDQSQGDVFVEIGLVGDLKGRVVFGFTKEFSSGLVESMLSFAPEEIDELVCSALAEVSNIASGNGTIAISQEGTACDIRPPKILERGLIQFPPHEEVQIQTKLGTMTVAVYLD